MPYFCTLLPKTVQFEASMFSMTIYFTVFLLVIWDYPETYHKMTWKIMQLTL